MPNQLVREDRPDRDDNGRNKMRSVRPTQTPTSAPSNPAKAVLYTTSEELSTPELISTSRYYTSISLPRSGAQSALDLHAIHPTPSRYLRLLAPEQLISLRQQLTTGVTYESDKRDRVYRTVDAIDEILDDEDSMGEQLRLLAPEQLINLKQQLTTGVTYESDMRDRVNRIIDAIDEILDDEDFWGSRCGAHCTI